jgi:hypothetical protein
MNHIERQYIPMQTSPLMIGDTMLQFTETIRPNIDLSTLSPPSKTINHSDYSCCSVLISNNTFLFSNQKHNLSLVNQKMILAKEVVWSFNTIIDMCWSLILNQFILINENDFILVNENIMSIKKIQTISNNK